MLDFNHRLAAGDVSGAIEAQLHAAIRARGAAEPRRNYLGASALGDPCDRRLCFEMLGVEPDRERFEPRIRSIFARGHALEALAREDMRAAGFEVAEGGEFSQLGGRFQGHVDGTVTAAPIAMRLPCLWEHKGLGSRGWRRLRSDGLAAAYPGYAIQVAIYQAYCDLPAPALFTATNADTMERLHLMVPFDAALAQRASDRAVRIVEACEAGELLGRCAARPDHFECRMCAWAETCWRRG